MRVSDRDVWTLNFYRNSELHGALLMGRLARTLADTALLAHVTHHCATEARHAALLSEAIVETGGRIDPRVKTIQEYYGAAGGVPAQLVDLLVLSEVLEHRVLNTYRAHLARPALHPVIQRTLSGIVRDMEEEDHGDGESWIESALDACPRDQVEAAEAKWHAVDERVVKELGATTDAMFAGVRAR